MAKAFFLGIISLIILLLDICIFQLTGVLGLLLCMLLVYLVIGSVIRILNTLIDVKLFKDLDILFFMEQI